MTYLPKSELVGVLAPYSINARDIGVNYQNIGQILAPVDAARTGAISYLGNGIIVAGMENDTATGDHILRSTDYGKTWTDLGIKSVVTGRFNDSVYLGNGIVIFVDSAGHVYRSIDFGVTWTDQGTVPGAITISSISYLGNGIVVFCVANGHIWRSTTYGSTGSWVDIGDITLTANPLRVTVYLENGIAITGADNQHVYRSIDFGTSWSDLGVITTAGIRFAGFYLGNGIGIISSIGIVDGGKIWRSIDFGLTWTNVFALAGPNTFIDGIYIGDGISIITNANGHVYRSVDFGVTWTDLGVKAVSGSINKVDYLDNGVIVGGDTGNDILFSDVAYKTDEAEVLIDPAFITTNANKTIGQSHNMVNVDASFGNITITLLVGTNFQIGHEFVIKKTDGTVNTVTIQPSGGDLIDGDANKVLTQRWQSITIRTDRTEWYIVSSNSGSGVTGFILGQLKPNVTRYAMPGWNVTRGDVSATLTIGKIYYIPFYYSTTTTATEIAVDVTGAVGGSTIDLRIFEWSDGVPGALFANLGTISSASTGVKTIAISVTFPQGLYFMAMRASATVSVRANNFSFPIAGPVGAMNNSNTGSATDFCDQFITTKTAAYADPAPAPDAMQGAFPFFLLQEN